MIALYENIKNIRTARGLSQNELAKLMGYKDPSSIAKIESGQNEIPLSKIKEFAKILDVTPGDLMGWNDEEITLSWDEKALLSNYRSLNKNARQLIREMAADFKQIRRHVED